MLKWVGEGCLTGAEEKVLCYFLEFVFDSCFAEREFVITKMKRNCSMT